MLPNQGRQILPMLIILKKNWNKGICFMGRVHDTVTTTVSPSVRLKILMSSGFHYAVICERKYIGQVRFHMSHGCYRNTPSQWSQSDD